MSELEKIRKYLVDKPRDLLLFEIALQSQVPVQDILGLKVRDLRELQVGDSLPFQQSRENGTAPWVLNEVMHSAFRDLVREHSPRENDFLFKSRKGDRPLAIPSVSRIIRGWREATGVTGINGLPGLRQALQKELAEVEAANRGLSWAENAVLPKVQSKTVQEIVYSELENAIISGRIAPGKKLITEEISKMMDVSRIPVREAMGRLEARGFIYTRPKWGSVVKELSRENLQEISELRIQLEPKAAEKAVNFVDDKFLRELERAQEVFAKVRMTSDTGELLKSNRNFHFLIYKQAFSPILLDLIKQLWDKVSPYYHIMFAQSLEKSPKIGISYHEKIVENLKNKDQEGVRQWVQADLIDSTDYILKLFDQFKMGKNKNITDCRFLR